MFWNKLPHCDKLFKKYLSPWYPLGDKPYMIRPDMYVIAAFEGERLDINDIQYLDEDALTQTMQNFDDYRKYYMQDFQHFVKFDKLDLEVIDAVDNYFGETEVKELIKRSDPKDLNNKYLAYVTEFGLALGDLFVETGKFEWLYSYPDFHSIVVNPETGNGITVFDWAVKKFSSYGISDGFKAKFLKAIEIVNEDINNKNVS